jgi:FlaA1/EpsC-like NDP-sugar epimerase
MTIPEAAQLVIQASVYAARSDIFVLDMGQPVRILTLAETLIKLAGLRPYEDIDIVEIGLRPGEKLYEELLLNTKTLKKTENEKIYIEYGQNIKPENIRIILNSLQKALDTENNDIIRKTMMEIIPTFLSADDVNKDAVSEIESRFMGKVI